VYESFETNILLVYDTFDSSKIAEWNQFALTYRIVGRNLHVLLIAKNWLLCYCYYMYTCKKQHTNIAIYIYLKKNLFS